MMAVSHPSIYYCSWPSRYGNAGLEAIGMKEEEWHGWVKDGGDESRGRGRRGLPTGRDHLRNEHENRDRRI